MWCYFAGLNITPWGFAVVYMVTLDAKQELQGKCLHYTAALAHEKLATIFSKLYLLISMRCLAFTQMLP